MQAPAQAAQPLAVPTRSPVYGNHAREGHVHQNQSSLNWEDMQESVESLSIPGVARNIGHRAANSNLCDVVPDALRPA